MEFSFFTTNNKSGYKTRESWVSKYHMGEYDKIITYCEPYNIATFKEKIWFYYHKLTSKPTCEGCGGDVKFSGRLDRGYQTFCSLTCANNNPKLMVEKQKQSTQKKYGVDFYTQHEDFSVKRKETKKNRYGDENYNNIIQTLKTKKEKYGNKNYNNSGKAKETSLSKYGTTNPSKSETIKVKIKKTNQKKYGTNSPTQNEKIKNKVKKSILNNISSRFNDNEFVSYDFKTQTFTLNCSGCGNTYTILGPLYNERNRLGYGTCTHCNPIGIKSVSKSEKEILDFIGSLGISYLPNDRKILNGRELDIYIPKHNLAIEFNGLYWHNELYKDGDYHLDKTVKCRENGVELIHIFEDEWLFNSEIVKSIIKNRLNLVKDKIYARKCKIREITPKQSEVFLNENHIQGYTKSKIKLGLFYDDMLVSVMTFGIRGGVGSKDDWELIRFCNKLNTNVVGGASKLFKYFIKTYGVNHIISYSDERWFNGDLYKKLGFKYIHISKPSYWYVIENKRYHRLNYKKSKLIKQGFDPSKTERQIMLERKIYRVYDCGNKRWAFTNK